MRRKSLLLRVAPVALVAVGGLVIASCGGGGGFFSGITNAVGQALRPVGNLIDENPIPFGDAVVTLVDFADDNVGRTSRTQEVGRTDADGNYSVDIPGQRVAAIIITGDNDQGQAVRVSGLVIPDQESVSKTLDSVTDIACEAGLSSLNDGSVSPALYNQQRVDNLENAAGDYVAANPDLDILNPAEVSAAAMAVRTATNDGLIAAPTGAFDQPAEETPAEETPMEETGTELNCASGTFTCADGGAEICAEFVCNSANDCADGSDEDPAVCGEQSGCCVATAGCPSETGTSCGETCCCCGINEICNRDAPELGCVSTNGRGVLDPNNPLSKLINGTYF